MYLPDTNLVFNCDSDKKCFRSYTQEARIRSSQMRDNCFKILPTKSMCNLYSKVQTGEEFQYLLTGTTESGKTMTIYCFNSFDGGNREANVGRRVD